MTPLRIAGGILFRDLFRIGGRASRREFLWGLVVLAPLYAALMGGARAAAAVIGPLDDGDPLPAAAIAVLSVVGVFSAWLAVAGTTLVIRRFHDRSISVVWLLVVAGVMVALMGRAGEEPALASRMNWIVLAVVLGILAVCLLPSKPGANKWGPPPHGIPGRAGKGAGGGARPGGPPAAG